MEAIYLDNAATSFPKPAGVSDRMKYYLDCVGANVNRSVYTAAQEAGLSVARYLAWQQLKQLDPAASPEDALALKISEVRELAGFRNANFPCQQERKED